MTLKQRLHIISKDIIDTKNKFHRTNDEIKLLAVSKNQTAQDIKSLFHLGITSFGENYLQEALIKQAQLTTCDIEWHFIGPIQSNKTNLIAQNFTWVQSVCREKIAVRLNQSASALGKKLNILIQVNLNNEASKEGISPGDLNEFCETLLALPHLTLRGLMAIPKKTSVILEQQQHFNELLTLYNTLKKEFNFDTLSMGMSGDYKVAIEKGSTLIRVGTKLFGLRK